MSLTRRKRLPLTRDITRLRDDRLFIIACDDTYAPKQYFEFFRIPRVQVHVIPTEDGTSAAKHVLNRLMEIEREEDDELWLLLDADHNLEGNHFRGYMAAITEARQRGVKVALSKPCFELWLLLHHVEESLVTTLANANAVAENLRAKLGEYNKTHLREKHYLIGSVPTAYDRAKRLDATVLGGDRPQANTTRVYKIWESFVSKALPSQLPSEFHSIKNSG